MFVFVSVWGGGVPAGSGDRHAGRDAGVDADGAGAEYGGAVGGRMYDYSNCILCVMGMGHGSWMEYVWRG